MTVHELFIYAIYVSITSSSLSLIWEHCEKFNVLLRNQTRKECFPPWGLISTLISEQCLDFLTEILGPICNAFWLPIILCHILPHTVTIIYLFSKMCFLYSTKLSFKKKQQNLANFSNNVISLNLLRLASQLVSVQSLLFITL